MGEKKSIDSSKKFCVQCDAKIDSKVEKCPECGFT